MIALDCVRYQIMFDKRMSANANLLKEYCLIETINEVLCGTDYIILNDIMDIRIEVKRKISFQLSDF